MSFLSNSRHCQPKTIGLSIIFPNIIPLNTIRIIINCSDLTRKTRRKQPSNSTSCWQTTTFIISTCAASAGTCRRIIFFVLREDFEELYNRAAETLDDIAERIITIGKRPLHIMEEYVKQSTLKSKKDIAHPEVAVDAVIEDQVEILKKLRETRAKADESGDVATVVMLEDFLVFIEKKIGMLNAWRQQSNKK